jgi:glycosyltransferase involved in cell wall biosynthesis
VVHSQIVRIAYFLEYPLASQGGVSVLVRALIEDLSDEFECILISPDSAASLQESLAPAKVAAHIPWPDVRQAPSWEFQKAALNVVDEISHRKVNLCHFHCGGVFGWGNRWPGCNVPAMLKKRGISSVWTNHLVVSMLHGYCGPEKPLSFKLAMLPMAWLGKAQQLSAVKDEICVSNHDASKLRLWYFPFRKKIRRIYHSRCALPHELPARLSTFDSHARLPVILSVGHVAWRKGQHILAEAFALVAANHPDWELQIAGEILEEDCAEHIRKIAHEHGLEGRIKLLGARNDASALMRKCGIFVQPSLQEALGLALQEALCYGCPCVGTKTGGIPELIRNGENGLLVSAGNSHALASSLAKLLSDAGMRQRLGNAAPQSPAIRDMTRKRMAEAHAQLYRLLEPPCRILSKDIICLT